MKRKYKRIKNKNTKRRKNNKKINEIQINHLKIYLIQALISILIFINSKIELRQNKIGLYENNTKNFNQIGNKL